MSRRAKSQATPRSWSAVSVAAGVELSVTELGGVSDGPTLAIVAGVHGDEVEGIAALEDWLAGVRLDAGRVLAIPIAHPAALAAGTRLGPDGVDLNRVAPGSANAREPTRRIAHGLTRLLADEADLLVTLHSWSRSGDTVPYVEYPSVGDGDVCRRARALAHVLGLPWAEPWDWPDGLVPAALCRCGVPAVEVEIGGLGRTTPGGQAMARAALDAAVRHAGLLRATEAVPPATTVVRSWVNATAGGRVRQLVPLGGRVRAGQAVAEIRAPGGAIGARLTAGMGGFVGTHATYGVVERGDPVAALFRPL